MVSDSVLVNRLREIIETADLDIASMGSVRRQLEQEFEVSLKDRKAFIKERIDVLLEQRYQGEKEQRDNDKKEEESENVKDQDVDNDGSEGKQRIDEEKSKNKRPDNVDRNVKKRVSGFHKLCALSPQLQALVGEPELARPEVVKKIWAHIRENNLQNPANKKNILCDKTLQAIFGVDTVNMFKMNKLLSKHIWPIEINASQNEQNLEEQEEVEEDYDNERENCTEEKDEKVEPDNAKQEEPDSHGSEDEKEEKDTDEERIKSKRSDKVDNNVKRKGGFNKPCSLSPQLQALVGEPVLARTEVVKKIWAYIREKNLQNPENRKQIICDETLQAIFEVGTVDMFKMNKLLSKHIWPVDNIVSHDKQHLEEEESSDEEESSEEEEESSEEEEESENMKREEADSIGFQDDQEVEGSDEKKNKKRGSSFSMPCALSPQLQALVGTPELARTEVVKRIWAYIREKNLQNPKNKKKIICDKTLKAIFQVDTVDMFKMNKFLSKHIWPIDTEDGLDEPKQKRKKGRKGELLVSRCCR